VDGRPVDRHPARFGRPRLPRKPRYPGVAYIALLADRGMPGDQPDTFIFENSPSDAAFARRAAGDAARCPSR